METLENKIKNAFLTEEGTLEELAKRHNTTYKVVWGIISRNFTKEERKARKSKNYRLSKLGDKNPMKGKCGELHHVFKGEVSDCKGYLLYLKPKWYTGRKHSKHIFYHNLVLCEALGITEIPLGWCVHHIDGNPLNNNINNLALLRTSAHTRLHIHQRKLKKEVSE
jgi:hypothetical protein